MVVNFRARRINRGTRKLARSPTLIKKKIIRGLVWVLLKKIEYNVILVFFKMKWYFFIDLD